MSLNRERLPDPDTFYSNEGLTLAGLSRAEWKTARCIFHGGSDSMRVNMASGAWVCMACNAKGGDVLAYRMQAHGEHFIDAAKALGAWVEDGKSIQPANEYPRAKPARPPARTTINRLHETLSDFGQSLVRECRPLAGVALQYLNARSCVIPPADSDLRFHPELPHPSGYTGPALVATVTDAITNQPISLHRTWIQGDGSKAPVHPARLLLGGHRKQRGVIRLWPDEAVTMGLGIAEGIETALSLAHAYTPVWAAIDAGNLAAFPVLHGIEVLLVARDNDPAGRDAAEKCGHRWAAADVDVRITEQTANDLNDIAREAA